MERKSSHLLVLVCLVNLLSVLSATATSRRRRSIADDQSALLAFKSQITNNDILANNWSINTSPCNWIGVSCSMRQQRVTALNLSNMGLSGTISPYLGNLSFLASLNVSFNSFHGLLPEELAHLRRLKQMNLRYNQLSGPIPSIILFNMSSLTKIDLSLNNLSGSLPVNFCSHLPKLKWLSVSSNQLSGQIPSKYLYKCKELQVLVLSINKFSGSIPHQIGNLTMLTRVYLGKNVFEGTLPHEIANLKNLESFIVGYNKLGENIPFNIFNISTVKVLDMGFNHFTTQFSSTMEFWLPNLEEIYLDNNTFSGTLPNSISNSSKLIVLELASNSFTGSIPDTLGNLRLLESLDLAYNDLTIELGFFTSLANCRFLKNLIFSEILINGILPSSVGNLSISLQDLYLDSCKIKGQIPLEIGNLSSLQELVLFDNELTGTIPTTIGSLKHLERLGLHYNRLEGSIPKDFCQLTKLGVLSLARNQLNGFIPECFRELEHLTSLDLNSNEFNSTIPSTLWSVNTLLEVDLSSNLLIGNLPSQIGNLKFLVYVDLSWNQFSGDIPNTIGDTQMLSFLSLEHNNLKGSIPQALGKLISLEHLDLSKNNLSGVIPKSLEALRYLQYLNVSFNRLCGEIPTGGMFVNFNSESFMENDALCGAPRLHVTPCKTRRRSRSRTMLFLKYIFPPVASVILLFTLLVLLKWYQNRSITVPHQSEPLLPSWKRVSYNELVRATESFSESNLLGTGSFGSIYKGVLSEGMVVAVKVFNMHLEKTTKSFDVECEVLRKVRHRNLVSIISSCTNPDFMALVLEYMPNGNLDKWLYSHNYFLDILQRLNIMIDVASALEYLHHGHTTPILHCDLKPSNVLVDEDMVAHVCDFGISKLLGGDEFSAQTTTSATIGYMAPEYGLEGIVSTSGDVYSYGILLMETFTRKKPTDEMFSSEMSLRSWVNDDLHGSLFQVVDTNLLAGEDEHLPAKRQCVLSIFGLALDCSKDSHVERISMKDVVGRLNKIKITLQADIIRPVPTRRKNV